MSIDKFGRTVNNHNVSKFGSSVKNSAVAIRGPPGVGFKRTADGDYDMQNKRLVNVVVGKDKRDAINKDYLDAIVSSQNNKIIKLAQNIDAVLKDNIKLNKINVNSSNTYQQLDTKLKGLITQVNANTNSIIELNKSMIHPPRIAEIYEQLRDVTLGLDALKSAHEKLSKDVNRLHTT